MNAAEHAQRIKEIGKALDYEQEALDSLRRSWELEAEHATTFDGFPSGVTGDPNPCTALALADAGVWATLHLARTSREPRQHEISGAPSLMYMTDCFLKAGAPAEVVQSLGRWWPQSIVTPEDSEAITQSQLEYWKARALKTEAALKDVQANAVEG